MGADFYPFGGERTPHTNTCTQNSYKFEGKERDIDAREAFRLEGYTLSED
jgi:hypothetical protein